MGAGDGLPVPQEEVKLLQEILAELKTQTETQQILAWWTYQGFQTLAEAMDQLHSDDVDLETGLAVIQSTLQTFLTTWEQANNIAGPPTGGSLSITGGKMGLSVDTTPGSESVTFQFEDDHKNAASAPTGDGSGIVVTLSSNDGGLTSVGDTVVGADANGYPTYTAPITVATTVPGNADFAVAYANESGVLLTEDDGETPFPATDDLIVPITAGDPVEGSLSVAAS